MTKAIPNRPQKLFNLLERLSVKLEKDAFSLKEIYAEFSVVYPDLTSSATWKSAIRNDLQRYCSTSRQFKGKHNLFVTTDKKWGARCMTDVSINSPLKHDSFSTLLTTLIELRC